MILFAGPCPIRQVHPHCYRNSDLNPITHQTSYPESLVYVCGIIYKVGIIQKINLVFAASNQKQMWVIRYSIKVNTAVFLQLILYVKESFLFGHPAASLAVTIRPPELGLKCLRSGQLQGANGCFSLYAHCAVRQRFLTFYTLCVLSPGSDEDPMPFVVQKVGTSSLLLASGPCHPELNLQLSLQLLSKPPALMHVRKIFCPRIGNYLFNIYYTPEWKRFQCFYSCPNGSTLLLRALKQTDTATVLSLQSLFDCMHRSSEHFPAASFNYKFSRLLQLSEDVSGLVIFDPMFSFSSRPLWIQFILYPNMLQEMTN